MSGIPPRYSLDSNRPNPFNPVTTISYSLATEGHTDLVILDISGRVVKSLVNGVQ